MYIIFASSHILKGISVGIVEIYSLLCVVFVQAPALLREKLAHVTLITFGQLNESKRKKVQTSLVAVS